MRGLATLVLSLLVAIACTGCGDGDTTVTSTVVDGTSTSTTEGSTTTGSDTSPGPSGELLANGVGAVKQGTTTAEAEDLFGPPDQQDQFSGCEFDPNSPATLQFRYDVPDGSLAINFEATSNEMVSYQTTSSQFPTTLGDRVGDSFQSLQDNWGSSLTALDIGAPSTPRAGYWVVRDSPEAELLFDISGSRIKSISGGYLPPCE